MNIRFSFNVNVFLLISFSKPIIWINRTENIIKSLLTIPFLSLSSNNSNLGWGDGAEHTEDGVVAKELSVNEVLGPIDSSFSKGMRNWSLSSIISASILPNDSY